jgi:hypothetical protein
MIKALLTTRTPLRIVELSKSKQNLKVLANNTRCKIINLKYAEILPCV